MVRVNEPLSRHKSFDTKRVDGIGLNIMKDPMGIARAIVANLTHPEAVRLVASEWEMLGSRHSAVLGAVRRIANEAHTHPSSHNQAKMIQRLDALTGGDVLKREHVVTEQVLQRGGGGWTRRRIDPARAGAARAYAAVSRPSNYASLSPAEKRRVNKRIAAERRAAKRTR